MNTSIYAPDASRAHTGLSDSTVVNAEAGVVLACARVELDPTNRENLLALLGNGLDYDRLMRIASFQRLVPLLYWHLNTVGSERVPDVVLEMLRGVFISNSKKMLEWTMTLIEVVDFLGKDGILAVPYKGPALASRLYGNIGLRQCSDIDILVARRDVKRARQSLEEAGFHNLHPTSPASQEFILRNRYSEIFSRDKSPAVELHWGFTSRSFGFQLELKDIASRLIERPLGGRSVKVFGSEDLLLILCVHGAKHCWCCLEMVSSVAELVRREEIDWQLAFARAMELRAEKTLFLGLVLAYHLLDAPVPAAIIERARSSRDVIRLAALVRHHLVTHDWTTKRPPNSLPRDLFKLRLQRTSRDRLRYVYHRLTTPKRVETRRMVPLGKHSVPLYSILRPFMVAGKLIKGVFRG